MEVHQKCAFAALPDYLRYAVIGLSIQWRVVTCYITDGENYAKVILDDGRAYEFDKHGHKDWRLRFPCPPLKGLHEQRIV